MDNDLVDVANLLASKLADAGIKAAQSLVPNPVDIAEDEEVFCETCGDTLDIRRARLGFFQCTWCKTAEEKSNRHTRIRSYDE